MLLRRFLSHDKILLTIRYEVYGDYYKIRAFIRIPHTIKDLHHENNDITLNVTTSYSTDISNYEYKLNYVPSNDGSNAITYSYVSTFIETKYNISIDSLLINHFIFDINSNYLSEGISTFNIDYIEYAWIEYSHTIINSDSDNKLIYVTVNIPKFYNKILTFYLSGIYDGLGDRFGRESIGLKKYEIDKNTEIYDETDYHNTYKYILNFDYARDDKNKYENNKIKLDNALIDDIKNNTNNITEKEYGFRYKDIIGIYFNYNEGDRVAQDNLFAITDSKKIYKTYNAKKGINTIKKRNRNRNESRYIIIIYKVLSLLN